MWALVMLEIRGMAVGSHDYIFILHFHYPSGSPISGHERGK